MAYNIKILVWIERGVSEEHLGHSCKNLHVNVWSYVMICITKLEKMVPCVFLNNQLKHENIAPEESNLIFKIRSNIFPFKHYTYLVQNFVHNLEKNMILSGF